MQSRKIIAAVVVLIMSGSSVLFSREWTNESSKTIFKIEGGTRIGLNLDHNAFGVENYIRELGLWYEVLEPDDFRDAPGDSARDSLQLSIRLEGLKFAHKFFRQNLNSTPNASLEFPFEVGVIDFSLFWKGFSATILSNQLGMNFNHAARSGLFVPRNDWMNNPHQFAPRASYYTLNSPLISGPASTAFTLGPASQWGLLGFGYSADTLRVKLQLGTPNGGYSLNSDPAELNTDNVFAFSGDIELKPVEGFIFAMDAVGGVNLDPDRYGVGAGVEYEISAGTEAYLVPFIGSDYSRTNEIDTIGLNGGFKFLWKGTGNAGRNPLSGDENPRGLSITALFSRIGDSAGQADLRLGYFDPAGAGSLVQNLGFAFFAEMKNISGESSLEEGNRPFGAVAKLNYVLPAYSLAPYLYGHYKQAASGGTDEWLARIGVRHSGISSNLVIDGYYVVSQADMSADQNTGNFVLETRVTW
ncbi:hypothetical protein [Spirochaeta dissipatitropha]